MSTSVARYCPSVLPLVVSKYATPCPPSSKFSASIKPGTAHGVPPNGVLPGGGGGGGGGAADVVSRNQFKSPAPPPDATASRTTRSTRTPAVSGTPVVVTVCQFCQ